MKKFMALALGLLVSTAAQAAMNVDLSVDLGGQVIEGTCLFDDQNQLWTLEHDGYKVVFLALEQSDETVLVAVSAARVNEFGEEVAFEIPETVGGFNQEMVLDLNTGTEQRVVIKITARKVVAVDPVA